MNKYLPTLNCNSRLPISVSNCVHTPSSTLSRSILSSVRLLPLVLITKSRELPWSPEMYSQAFMMQPAGLFW